MTRATAAALPFTIDADLDLGDGARPWQRAHGADVTLRQGAVPNALPDVEAEGVVWQRAGDRVLIAPPCGVRFLVESGVRIRYAVEDATARTDLRLFLLGIVWSTLALQRGLLPLHASAVERGAGLLACAGSSASGKSTLAAALAARGFPFFADDVLLLDPADFGHDARCFGHKELKLWPDALPMTGARALRAVRRRGGFDKVYASPRRQSSHTSLPIETLVVLRTGRGGFGEADPLSVERISGGWKLRAIFAAVHYPRLALSILGHRGLHRPLAALSSKIEVFEFHRPRRRVRFDEGVTHLLETLPAASAPIP